MSRTGRLALHERSGLQDSLAGRPGSRLDRPINSGFAAVLVSLPDPSSAWRGALAGKGIASPQLDRVIRARLVLIWRLRGAKRLLRAGGFGHSV
jgi:hypothetical protein